jgi:hypothetical protein
MAKPHKVEEPAATYPTAKVLPPAPAATERPAVKHAKADDVRKAAGKVFSERNALLHRLAQ